MVMMAFCWLVRSESKETSKETVPLPSSMLVRRRMPVTTQSANENHTLPKESKIWIGIP